MEDNSSDFRRIAALHSVEEAERSATAPPEGPPAATH